MASATTPQTKGLDATALKGKADAMEVFGLLDKLVRVTVSDGRVLMGNLKCLDGSGNLVLAQAESARTREEVEAETIAQRQARWMGSVLVSPADLVKVEVAQE